MIFGSRQTTVQAALRQFFGVSPLELPIVARKFSTIELPNIQRGIETVIKRDNGSSEEIGYVGSMSLFNSFGELLSETKYAAPVVGPVQYRDVEVGHGKWHACRKWDFSDHSWPVEICRACKN